jgi:tRNA(Ile)-lysidine synthase
MWPRRGPLRSASDALTPGAAQVDRFRADLSPLFDLDSGRLLVAVSGGGDSMALLLLAHAALGDRCCAATVDHGFRPESAEEAATVAAFCAARGIEHAVLRGDLPPRVGRTANLSSRARAMRYALLEAERARVGASAIATGHHADDQVETLVMRLNRGSGVAGLAGVRAVSGHVVRPLLGWRRDELAQVVAACGVATVDDPTNVDDRFDRARLRKELGSMASFDAEGWRRSAAALADASVALDYAADLVVCQQVERSDGAAGFAPGDLPFELRRRVCLACLRHVDQLIDPRGDELSGLVHRLEAGQRATLGTVMATVDERSGGTPYWRFGRAPERRAR